jgi:outer membrane immunogenic protein
LGGGLEADIQYADLHDSQAATAQGSGGFAPEETSVDQRIKWLGTVRARLGVLPIDRLLLYVTGGLAYGRAERTATIAFPIIPQTFSGSENTTQAGWTAGGGVEWAFFKNWSVKAEYLYYDLGKKDVDIVTVASSVAGTASGTFETKGHIVRAGLNFRF